MGIAALVLGIMSFCCGACTGVPAIVLGAIAAVKSEGTDKICGIIGLILGILGSIIGIVMGIYYYQNAANFQHMMEMQQYGRY